MDLYLRTLESAAADDLLSRTDRDSRAYDETLVRRLEIRDASGGHPNVVVAGRPATIAVDVTEHLPSMECQLTVVNSLGQPVCTFDSEMTAPVDVRDSEPGTRLECHVESLPLLPGRYRIDVIVKAKRHIQDGLQAAALFDVEPGTVGERPVAAEAEGDVVLPHSWRLPA